MVDNLNKCLSLIVIFIILIGSMGCIKENTNKKKDTNSQTQYNPFMINEIYTTGNINSENYSAWIEFYNPSNEDSGDIYFFEIYDKYSFKKYENYVWGKLKPRYVLHYNPDEPHHYNYSKITINETIIIGDPGLDIPKAGKIILYVIIGYPDTKKIEIDKIEYGLKNQGNNDTKSGPRIEDWFSIARYKGGYDTDNSNNDFYLDSNPTPGLENNLEK